MADANVCFLLPRLPKFITRLVTRFDACLFGCGAGGALSCRGLEVGVEFFCGRKLDGGGVDGIFGDWRVGGGFGGVVGGGDSLGALV